MTNNIKKGEDERMDEVLGGSGKIEVYVMSMVLKQMYKLM